MTVEPATGSQQAQVPPDDVEIDFSDFGPIDIEPDGPAVAAGPTAVAQVHADISAQWSWASSAARIPQISDLTVDLSEPIEHARVSIVVRDADLELGSKVVFEGPLQAGQTAIRSVHVPLSARVMSQLDERRSGDCAITLEDVGTGAILARVDESIDVQPRDLWLWDGDPRRAGVKNGDSWLLSHSLLASFVRPNHPEIAVVAREAAAALGRATKDPSFSAFQKSDVAEAEQRADATVTAIYEALQTRAIAYSEPPPSWDFRTEGQRIRDHGDVARGGLGTCMDTTVLMAAVIEQVGLHPVLVLVPGHIFIGYWRRDPLPETGRKPEWYPDSPVVADLARIHQLVEGGWLGVIETTTFTAGKSVSAGDARSHARHRVASVLDGGFARLVDVAAARGAGVSPLPAINERADGVTEIIEYRPGGAPVVTEVAQEPVDPASRQRQVDDHPARYRTWKSSLFSLNATNALLNLGSNARVQPLAIPPGGLGMLEDRLNQDRSFSIHSGYDIPAVWRARDIANAIQLLESGDPEDHRELMGHLNDRRLYVQRTGRVGGQQTWLSPSTFVKEIRSMAHNAKTARDERGMNPLFLCLGILRWPYKPDVLAEAPLILVPVNISVTRGRQEFSLSLDSSQQATPNAALIEWLRREHGLSVPGLGELPMDRAGIDIDGILSEVRKAVAERGLPFEVAAEARLATLDLSAFRMWQDLNLHAESFLERPLVRHLVQTPTEQFEDPAADAEGDIAIADELEKLETPIPADSTQKRAVLWARQGRTFVLQGPPGTGKSQTITNMVSECVMSGLRVLFVAEKGTALAVVQRRLETIGLGPFTLNLHHEGSNATEVRAQLKRALTATVTADPAAMESARRRLRNARFELMQYPQQLHEPNASGLSAYSAHDQQLVLGEGTAMPLPSQLVAHQAEKIGALKGLFQNLQQWTAAVGVRPDHPWRLAGPGAGDPIDVELVGTAVRGVLDGATWAVSVSGPLGDALDAVVHPRQLRWLSAAANQVLPGGDDLAEVLSSRWLAAAPETVTRCEKAVEGWSSRLCGFSPDVLSLDLRGITANLSEATASGIFGRSKRQVAAIAPLAAFAPYGMDLQATNAAAFLADLVQVQDAAASVRSSLTLVPGLARAVPTNPFHPGALVPVRDRLDELVRATVSLRDGGEWSERVRVLAQGGHLAGLMDPLSAYADAWQRLWSSLLVDDADFEAWRAGRTLTVAAQVVEATWRRQTDFERLLPLQHWCTLVRKLTPLRDAGLDAVRVELLEGSLPAYAAEDALARGIAQASLAERVAAAGLDRFNAVAHDERVVSYTEAQEQVRAQWVTDGPAQLLDRRGGGGAGKRTGHLARELEKTTRKLGTRSILRKHGEAVQELTPLVLCSPSSVVDLIEPGVMDFDVVIFDEASQITVPEAVGALGRARAAIVVGDSKQMPPTRRVGGQHADDEEIDDPDAEEIVEDQESILSECELARVPTLSLNWHYRSQDEALIAFSNRAYYRGDLSSFPTPTLLSSETGMEFRRVDGRYLRAGTGKVDLGNGIIAGSNTNPDEAVAIVAAVHDLVHQSGDKLPSLGIVTFNEQQRQLIEDLLLASSDPRLAQVMDETTMGRGDVLFVKALEQVQGDERDVVIFSVAFSKQANGKIPTNFGPLSNSGGERRLNVAVTRARRKNLVFCSFEPGELDVSGSAYKGPKDLKEFLSFAKSSGSVHEPGEKADRAAIRDRHRDDIAEALRGVGLHVMSDVGLSNFRLDLVLARPESPRQPLLPILLDGESWKRRSTVSDRDVLPVEVLQNLMGWPTVARIWWPMWLQNRTEVIDRILAEVGRAEEALTQMAVEVPVPSGPAPDPEEAHLTVSESVAVASPARSEFVEPAPRAPEPEPLDPEPIAGVVGHAAPFDAIAVTQFVPARANAIGSRDVLDALPGRAAAATVREQLLDVIEAEGPVELARLTRIVARRFGLTAVRAGRAEDIARLVPRGQLRKGRLGSFAWPTGIDPETWTAFRSVDPDASRSLDEVAPEEIANAMRAVLGEHPGIADGDVLRRTAELFGIARLGANVRSRLEAVFDGLSPERTTTRIGS